MNSHFAVRAMYGEAVITKNYFVTTAAIAREHAFKDGAKYVYRIREVKPSFLDRFFTDEEYAMTMLRSISFQIQAGESPVRAVRFFIESETNAKKRARLQSAQEALYGGDSIANALFATGYFDSTVRSILLAEEMTGTANAIMSAQKYMETAKEGSRAYLYAIRIIVIELASSVAIPPVIESTAIPYIQTHLPKGTPEQLFIYREQLEALRYNNHMWILFGDGIMLLVMLIMIAWFADHRAKLWIIQNLMNRIPVVKDWYISDSLSRTCGIFAEMLQGGVRINNALTTIIRSTTNIVAQEFWSSAQSSLNKGASVEKAFAGGKLLRADEINVIAAAKGSVQLGQVFAKITIEREWRKKILGQKIFNMSVGLMFIHIIITLVVGFRLFTLFSAGFDMSIENAGAGGF